jgi:hypothetical protein
MKVERLKKFQPDKIKFRTIKRAIASDIMEYSKLFYYPINERWFKHCLDYLGVYDYMISVLSWATGVYFYYNKNHQGPQSQGN